MYFSGVAEEYYDFIIGGTVRSERLNAYLDEITEGIEVVAKSGNKEVGKHLG